MKLPIIGASLLLSACIASRTTIHSTWADGQFAGPPLDRVAVAAMFETRADSLAFERHAADYLTAQGVDTISAHELLSSAASPLDETQVREQIAATDIDGILIFRLIAVDERREYQAPTLFDVTPEQPNGDTFSTYARPSSSYYWFPSSPAEPAGPSVYSQGYWIEQTFLVAETALFDNREDRLLWTAKSETMDDVRFERTSESIVRSVVRRLFATDLIAPSAEVSGSAPEGSRG